MKLTKSHFLAYLDSPLHLWLKVHGDVHAKPLSVYDQHIMMQGYSVEKLAKEFLEKKVAREYPAGTTIEFEAVLTDGNYESRIDALVHDVVHNTYDLYEIKSSTTIHTEHKYDVTFQHLVAKANLAVNKTYLVRVNSDYRREGEIEDPKQEPKLEQILQVRTLPEQAPDKAEYLEIEFLNGLPVALNGKQMSLVDLIHEANSIVGKHGVGYTILIEDRLVGLKVRGVYEAPAAHVITLAHYNLEKLVSTQTENELKEFVDSKWAYLCYSAKWQEPTMQHLNVYIDSMNQKVSGIVKLKLYKGRADVVSVSSPNSLFDADLATFNKNGKFNQNSSAGFIELYSLAMKTAAIVRH